MSDKKIKIYGSWLRDNYDYQETKSYLDSIHDENYPRFKSRVEHYEFLANDFIKFYKEKFPNLSGKISINYAAINGGLARYFNDVIHYKLWHPIIYINKARVISYSISWLTIYNPISISLTKSEYESLGKEERKFTLRANILFCLYVMRWYLNGFNFQNQQSIKFLYKRVSYLIQTNQFEPKNIAVAFEVAP